MPETCHVRSHLGGQGSTQRVKRHAEEGTVNVEHEGHRPGWPLWKWRFLVPMDETCWTSFQSELNTLCNQCSARTHTLCASQSVWEEETSKFPVGLNLRNFMFIREHIAYICG